MIAVFLYIALLFLFVLGLIFGSFLNACIYRLPRDKSPLSGRSRCPYCDEVIPWYDNIPLFSFILLGGRCRHCGERISGRYFIVELVSAVIVAGCGWWWLYRCSPDWFNFLLAVFFILISLAITLIDIDFSIIPNQLNYLLIITGLAAGFFSHHPLNLGAGGQYQPEQFYWSFGGLIIGGGLFLILAIISAFIYGKTALGMGDVKLIAGYGAWLGPSGVLLTIILGSIIGAVIGTAIVKLKGKTLKEQIPFGPFLCFSGVVSYIFGPWIISWYLGLALSGL